MIGVSGCFGGGIARGPIDDIAEAEIALGDIVDSASRQPDEPTAREDEGQTTDLMLAQLVEQYARRVRLLTWAVVAIAAYLLINALVDKP